MTDNTDVQQLDTVETQSDKTSHQAFLEALPEDMRSEPMFRNLQSVEDLAKGYINAQKLVGLDKNAVLRLPSSEDDKDGWGNIYSKLGRPDDVKGYELEKYKDVQGTDPAALEKIAQVAHEVGVSKAQFQKIVDTFMEDAKSKFEQSDTQTQETLDKYVADLQKEWGSAYEQKTQKVINTLQEHATEGFKELAKNYPWIFDNPDVMKTFDNIIKLSTEDTGLSVNLGSPNALTPAEALAEIRHMEGDKQTQAILMNSGDPRRVDILAKRKKLFEAAYGS